MDFIRGARTIDSRERIGILRCDMRKRFGHRRMIGNASAADGVASVTVAGFEPTCNRSRIDGEQNGDIGPQATAADLVQRFDGLVTDAACPSLIGAT